MRRLDENRTEYDLGNGCRQLIIQRGHNYFDRDAQTYLETPKDLLADSRSAGFSHIHKGPAWKRMGKGGLHRVGFKRGADVTYIPVGAANIEPAIEGNVATYHDLWPSVDVSLQVFPEGVKETIVLRDRAATNSFVWDVVTRGCVLNDLGEFIDTLQGQIVGRLAAVAVQDANGVPGPVSLTCTAESVTMELDRAWLDSPERVYPVTIDPTTTIQPDATAGIDTFINSASPTTNYGTATSLEVSTGRSSLLKFDLSAIPSGAQIISAVLSLYCYSGYNYSYSGEIAPLTAAWDETQATWNVRLTGVNWVTAGGDVDNTQKITFASTPTNTAALWHDWTVTSIVRNWVNGALANNGLRISTSSQNVYQYYSSDAASNRPKLVVVWTVKPTPTSPLGTVLAPSSIADTLTPRLSWTNDASITQSQYQVQVADTLDNLKVDSGQVVSANTYYDVPTGAGLAYGTTYKWRVQIYDGANWTGYTDWQYFVCKVSAPTGFTATLNPDHARIDFTWIANSQAAGYNLYRRKDGTTTWELVNLSLLSGTSFSDDTAQCGQTYEYTIASVASNGYEGDKNGTVHATLAFTGAWIGDSRVHLRTPPVITRPRRASRRVDIRGKHVIQDWGYGERIMELSLVYKTQAELDALLALFPSDTAVSYRDELGRVFRGKVADDLREQPWEVWSGVMGVLNVTLTEVTP